MIHVLFFLGALFSCCSLASSYATEQETQEARIAAIIKKSKKYSENQELREKIKQKITKIKTLIAQHKDTEKKRVLQQEEFNNRILYQFNITSDNPLYIRNSDVGKGIFLLLDWGIEWCLYQRLHTYWADFASSFIAQNLDEFKGAITQISPEETSQQALQEFLARMQKKEFFLCIAREHLPTIATHLLLEHLANSLRHYYLLDRTATQNTLQLLIANLVGIKSFDNGKETPSLFDRIEAMFKSEMPFSMLRSGILNQINNALQEESFFSIKLMPDWTQNASYNLAKHITFLGLFVPWSMTAFLQPKLIETIILNKESLLNARDKTDVQKIILETHKNKFPQWLTLKAERYSRWNTIANIAVMSPTVAKNIYTFVQDFKTNQSNNEAR